MHAEKILSLLAYHDDGLSRAEISSEFNRHLTKKQLDEALDILLNSTPPKIMTRQIKTDGALKTIYSLVQN